MRLQNDIINKEIVDDKGNILGKVKDIELDTSTRKVTSIIISKEEKNKFTIMKDNSIEEIIPFEEVGSIGDKIILRKNITDIDELINNI